MKLKIFSLFLSIILLSSCAGNKYFAQEFSASNLEMALHQSLDYNKKDGFYYDILKDGGYLLNVSQQRILTYETGTSGLKKQKMNKKAHNIEAFESFNKKYSILNKEKLEDAIFKAEPVYDNENYALNIESAKMEEQVKRFIILQYSMDNKKLKKLKLTSLSISGIKTESFLASAMPYIKAEYTVTATYEGKTVSVNLTDGFLIEIEKNGEGFTYSVGYNFYFDEVFNKKSFEESMAVALNKKKPSAAVQEILANEEIPRIGAEYKENWLELSKYSKTISQKYLYFLQTGSDLTKQISTQDLNYMKDTVFVGDSIFEGFTFYGLADAGNVLSKIGVGTRNILEMELTSDGVEYNLEEYILRKSPKRIYVMLGLNDINMVSEKQYNDNYLEIVKILQGLAPDADIVLTSITPIRKMSFSTPERIERYNDVAKAIAEKTEKVYFISLFDYLSVDGILANKYSAKDGIHFSKDTYDIMMNFINCHQIRSIKSPNDLLDMEKLEQLQTTKLVIDEAAIMDMIKAEQEKGKASPLKTPAKTEPEASVQAAP